MSAYKKLGFKLKKKRSGGHQVWKHPGPPVRHATLMGGKSDISKRTLEDILEQSEVSWHDFHVALGGRYKKEALMQQQVLERQNAAKIAETRGLDPA